MLENLSVIIVKASVSFSFSKTSELERIRSFSKKKRIIRKERMKKMKLNNKPMAVKERLDDPMLFEELRLLPQEPEQQRGKQAKILYLPRGINDWVELFKQYEEHYKT